MKKTVVKVPTIIKRLLFKQNKNLYFYEKVKITLLIQGLLKTSKKLTKCV